MDDDAATNEADTILKEGPVLYAGSEMSLKISSACLSISCDNSASGKQKKDLHLTWRDVISAQPSSKVKGLNVDKCFTLTFMQLQSNKKLQVKSVDISPTVDSSDSWIDAIQKQCASIEGRPKKLFVIVNPASGATSGQQVFEKKVRPIFEMSQIHSDVHITQKAKHAFEMAENQDFSAYDGIVVVGGDGSYHEVLQGLTIQTQKSAGVDYNDVNSKMKPVTKPIALIPSGTGNGVSGWMNGVIDVETAALRVVRGEQHKSTVYSVHSNGKLFAMCGLLIGIGLFSDLIKRSEELRWMKRARYAYCLLGTMVGKKRDFECSVEFQLAPESLVAEGSGAGDNEGALSESSKDSPWIKHEGKTSYRGISAFIADMVQRDGKMYCHVNPGHTSVLVDQGCSIISLLKTMLKIHQGKSIEPLPPNLEVVKKVQGIRVKILRDEVEKEENLSRADLKSKELEHYINLDGESEHLDVAEVELHVIPSFVPFYGIRMGVI